VNKSKSNQNFAKKDFWRDLHWGKLKLELQQCRNDSSRRRLQPGKICRVSGLIRPNPGIEKKFGGNRTNRTNVTDRTPHVAVCFADFSSVNGVLPFQWPVMSHDYVLKPYTPEIRLNIDYARELNEQQLAAVTAPPGPALVIAGAGSGKTRTLTYRVAYLLEQGIPADRILLLTFTNKAAGEMMRRVSDLLGHELRALWGGTFHSIGARVLRLHAETLGYHRDFSILDRDDANELIKACVVDAKIETKGTHFPKVDVLAEIFSLALNTHKSVKELLEGQFNHFEQFGGVRGTQARHERDGF
jgi:hypothetical protein